MAYAILYSCCGDLHPKDTTKEYLQAGSLQLFLSTRLLLLHSELLLISLNFTPELFVFYEDSLRALFKPLSRVPPRSVVFSMCKSFVIVGQDGNACLRSL